MGLRQAPRALVLRTEIRQALQHRVLKSRGSGSKRKLVRTGPRNHQILFKKSLVPAPTWTLRDRPPGCGPNRAAAALDGLRRLLFGKKKETLDIPQEELLPYFNELMEKLQASQKEVEKEKISYEREKKSKRSFRHFDMPEDAEREVIIHDLSDEEKVDPITGEMLECIGEDVREQLQYITGHYKVLEIHTKK